MKKLLFTILCLFCVLAFMPACSDDNESDPTVQPSVIGNLSISTYTLPQDESENPHLFRMNWTKTKFFTESGEPTFVDDIKYEVEVDLADNEFSESYTIHSTSKLYFDVYSEDLRSIYTRLADVDNKETISIMFRIKSTGNGKTGYSEAVSMSISPYIPAPEVTKVEPGTLAPLSSTNFVLQDPGNTNPVLFSAGWSETLFYFDNSKTPSPMSPLSYVLQIDKDGNNFASPENLATVSTLSADVHTIDLNTLLIGKFGATANTAINMQLRLLIKYGQGEAMGEAASTNTIKISVTPYGPYVPINPVQGMYIIGDLNGWNVGDISTMYPMFKSNQRSDNYIFSFVGYMPAGSFKFLPHESLNSYKTFTVSDGKLIYAVSDNAFYNAIAGYKSISIDVKNMTYEINDYDPSLATEWNFVDIAGSFNGWGGTPTVMSKLNANNKHIWVLDLTLPEPATGETHPMKFRGNGSWDDRWSPDSPEDAMYGTTTFNKNPDDNIVVREGGTFRVSFNDITRQYVFIKK